MHWKVSQAKQRLSDVLRKASSEPQLIFNRERLVAAVVGGEALAELQTWEDRLHRRSLADAFDELRRIEADEDYVLSVPRRRNRPNSFVVSGHGLPR